MSVLSLTTAAVTVLSPPADVNMTPDASQLPGYPLLKDLTNGIGGWALVAAMLGIVIGAIMWAFGHYSQNYQQALNGRRGVLVSGLAALLIGGAAPIINLLVQKGGTI
jgi:MFS family permease